MISNTINKESRAAFDRWYDFVLDNPKLWANRMTKKRLLKIKETAYLDEALRFDLLVRHNAFYYYPDTMKRMNMGIYHHCVGNLIGNLSSLIYENILSKQIDN